MRRVLIAAGGTGGHIFPGLAAAEALQALDVEVYWLGSGTGMESRLVPPRGIEFRGISIEGWRGRKRLDMLLAPFRLLAALWQTTCVFREIRPHCVLGMGGFAAGPGGIVACLARRPLIIHEQNALPGLTNRVLARFATRVLEGFEGAFDQHFHAHAVGNPVREELTRMPEPDQRIALEGKALRLVVLGGSRGALALNEGVPAALALLPAEYRPQVIHQAGRGKAKACEQAYLRAGVEAEVLEFANDMAALYASADLVVARAGALTLAELAAVGLGAILVPYPFAADDHQTVNARWMEQRGAAQVVPQEELTPDHLSALLLRLFEEPDRLREMARRSRALARTGSASQVAEVCLEVCTQ